MKEHHTNTASECCCFFFFFSFFSKFFRANGKLVVSIAFSEDKRCTRSLPLLQLLNQADTCSCLSRKHFLATMPFFSQRVQWYVQLGAVKLVLCGHWMHLSYMHQWRQRTNFIAPGCILFDIQQYCSTEEGHRCWRTFSWQTASCVCLSGTLEKKEEACASFVLGKGLLFFLKTKFSSFPTERDGSATTTKDCNTQTK